jgi:hypothetical protein
MVSHNYEYFTSDSIEFAALVPMILEETAFLKLQYERTPAAEMD